MKSSAKDFTNDVFWQVLGLVLAITAFALGYWFLPTSSDGSPRILPAFLLSIVTLLIGHTVGIFRLFYSIRDEAQNTRLEIGKELQRNSSHIEEHLDKTGKDVRNHLHLFPLGSPEEALEFVKSQLSDLKSVRNTSFNIPEEVEAADAKLYRRRPYQDLQSQIAAHVHAGLSWHDVGDPGARGRFESIQRHLLKPGSETSSDGGYEPRLIMHSVPQMNFMILNFKTKNRTEVLFNWDYRQGDGAEPTVLRSSHLALVQMFSIQYELLWKAASQPQDLVVDLDSNATKSTS